RLQSRGPSKPLVSLLGVPLIERVIRTGLEAGANSCLEVTGYRAEAVSAFLHKLSKRLEVPIDVLLNPDWNRGNGLSVLRARERLAEPFMLSMSDHLFDPGTARDLADYPLGEGEVVLAVDRQLENPLVNPDDVTGVKLEGNRITAIGKKLEGGHGYDTGLFRCTPAIFDALEAAAAEQNDETLSGGIRWLAIQGRAKALDTGEHFWIDVDDPADYRQAEKVLLGRLRDKAGDGPVSRWLNRPLSIRLSRWLVKFPVTPNQISVFSFLCSVAAAALLMMGDRFLLLLGGVLAQFASVVDGCDGEVARLKFQQSDYGGWLDAVLDRYSDAFLLFGLMWNTFYATGNRWALVAGFGAIVGSFLTSYTADKYDNLMRSRLRRGFGFRIGRDVRVFMVLLAALTGWVYPILWMIAVVMNVETFRRIWICRDQGKRS
ncbi:MAG: CDP-alcohol phosphatidyltransferase family protein, partial [bacterium]